MTANRPPQTGPLTGPLPGSLRWAVRLLRGEAISLGLFVAYLLYEMLLHAPAHNLAPALLVTAFAAAGAVALWSLAIALANRRAGARGPAIVLQLLLLPVGYQLIQSGPGWVGAVLIVLGLLVAGLIISPSTTKAMGLG